MELILTRPDATASQVTVTCDGQTSHTFDLSALPPNAVSGLRRPPADPVAHGSVLHAALFPPGSLAQQALAAKPKRIVFVAPDYVLDGIPWEYTYGPGGYVACACSFVRGLPEEERIVPPDILSGLHIVAVPSSPLSHDLAPLNVQGEWTRLVEIVEDTLLQRAVTLERAWPPTIARLRDLVVGKQQRVVHFMGHGGQNEQGETVLRFERENGAREEITAHEFVLRMQGSVLLVTLNACESATPGETAFGNLAKALVCEQVPYAVGMRFSVHDDDALAFSREFYRNLARGVSVEESLRQARLTLTKSEQVWAAGNPVLYTSLTHATPGCIVEPGEPDVRDVQEHALRGILGIMPGVQGAFQGRIDEQIHLGNWLTGDRRPRIMTIHGSGGQGKTALARVAAERFAHAWPGGVWAITLESVPTRAIFVTSLARFLGINLHEMAEPADLEQQVLLRLHRQRTLLILDNLEVLDEALKAQDAEALRLTEFILQLPSERTSLLCTSRHLLGWSGEQHLELLRLSPDEGAALFQQSAPHRIEEIDLPLARQLSQRVDGHPLGLFLLGKAFNATLLSLKAFLTDHETYLLSAENTFVSVDYRQRTLYANVAYSVKWLSSDLRSLLSKLWPFHAPFLPEIAIAIVDPEHEARGEERSPVADQLHVLWQRGLLTREGSAEQGLLLYRVPPVIRPYIERILVQASERETLLARYGSAYARLTWSLYRELDRGPVASTLAVLCYDDLERGSHQVTGIEQGTYLLRWGWVLHRLGDRVQGLALTEQAVELGQELDQNLTMQAMNNMAMVYRDIGRPQDALRLYEQALPILKEVGDRAQEATTLNNMAAVYSTIGRPQDAFRLYEQALPILKEVGDRAQEAATLSNIARVYRDIGRPQDALRLYEQALPILKEVGDRAGEATTLNNMAPVYRDIGRPQDALRLYEQALPILKEVGDRAGEATTLNGLAYLYVGLHRYYEAREALEQSIRLSNDVSHPAGEVAGLVGLALVLYQHLNQATEAITKMEQALAIMHKTGLSRDAAGQTLEQLEQLLQAMRDGTFSPGQSGASSTMPAKQIEAIVGNTIAVMTSMPERRAEWREEMIQAMQNAKQRGADWQIEVEFFTAILVILDGQSPMLPADHPYAQAITAIQDGIARGGLASDEDNEDDVPEEVEALAAFVQASVAALRSTDPQEKVAYMQQLVALQGQAPDDEMKALFQAIQLALFGGDLARLGDHLAGPARQIWEMIVASVQQDDTSQETPDGA